MAMSELFCIQICYTPDCFAIQYAIPLHALLPYTNMRIHRWNKLWLHLLNGWCLFPILPKE